MQLTKVHYIIYFLLDQPFLRLKIKNSQSKELKKKKRSSLKKKGILPLRPQCSMNFKYFFKKNSSTYVPSLDLKTTFRKIFVTALFALNRKKCCFLAFFPPNFCYKNRYKIWYTLLEKFSEKFLVAQLTADVIEKKLRINIVTGWRISIFLEKGFLTVFFTSFLHLFLL